MLVDPGGSFDENRTKADSNFPITVLDRAKVVSGAKVCTGQTGHDRKALATKQKDFFAGT
jgi:hypothetical protein